MIHNGNPKMLKNRITLRNQSTQSTDSGSFHISSKSGVYREFTLILKGQNLYKFRNHKWKVCDMVKHNLLWEGCRLGFGQNYLEIYDKIEELLKYQKRSAFNRISLKNTLFSNQLDRVSMERYVLTIQVWFTELKIIEFAIKTLKNLICIYQELEIAQQVDHPDLVHIYESFNLYLNYYWVAICDKKLKNRSISLNLLIAYFFRIYEWPLCDAQRHKTREYYAQIFIGSFPELLQNKLFDFKVDFFSIGVLLFQMLTGQIPFESENYNKRVQLNKQGLFDLSVANSSREALDFLQSFLSKILPIDQPPLRLQIMESSTRIMGRFISNTLVSQSQSSQLLSPKKANQLSQRMNSLHQYDIEKLHNRVQGGRLWSIILCQRGNKIIIIRITKYHIVEVRNQRSCCFLNLDVSYQL
ncbi:unnamed protein product (macronuclear) [Paramecium tetraurelia]|uniref:Protein kinase domain-containing protein n=1 Tax=Paramecium tetraurelia TaxID=5888 RepID=A0BHY4_PARTE|nr:uncharacterized protein GSPATT00029187001 [Paramecium tetraurelia]CAK58151.1 unnamed protein product [Paramecium tetraurelia]|eukprot:XP_001425549.1 hypothetical protein (macronuclear) [Paramecium tetraurelia strain d4-2]